MDTQIRLGNIQVTHLSFESKTFDQSVTATELNTQLSFVQAYSEENTKMFAIVFEVAIENPSKDFAMNTKITAHFESNMEIDEEFRNSSFTQISAPAIAFPFIRAFISNLTLNSGYNPIILPSFNFIKMAEDIQKEKAQLTE